jgi:hypothetical protein
MSTKKGPPTREGTGRPPPNRPAAGPAPPPAPKRPQLRALGGPKPPMIRPLNPLNPHPPTGSRPPPNIKLPSATEPLDEDDATSVMTRPAFDSPPAFPAAGTARPHTSPRPAAGRSARPEVDLVPTTQRTHADGTAILPNAPVPPPQGRSTTSGIGSAPPALRDLPINQRRPGGAAAAARDDGRSRAKGALGALGALGGGGARNPETTARTSPSTTPVRGPAPSVPPLDALIPKTRSTGDGTGSAKGGPFRAPSNRPRTITAPPTNTRSHPAPAPVSFPPPPNTKAMPDETLAMVRAPVAGAFSTVPLAPPLHPPQHHRHPSARPAPNTGHPPPLAPHMQSGATVATVGPPVARIASMSPPALGTLSPPAMPQGMPFAPTAAASTARAPGVLGFLLFAAPLAIATAAVAALALL